MRRIKETGANEGVAGIVQDGVSFAQTGFGFSGRVMVMSGRTSKSRRITRTDLHIFGPHSFRGPRGNQRAPFATEKQLRQRLSLGTATNSQLHLLTRSQINTLPLL